MHKHMIILVKDEEALGNEGAHRRHPHDGKTGAGRDTGAGKVSSWNVIDFGRG